MIETILAKEEKKMVGRFDGRVAFITGGSRGIGKGIVQLLAEEGAKVALIDVNEEALSETTSELKESGFAECDPFFRIVNGHLQQSFGRTNGTCSNDPPGKANPF